MNQNTTLLLTKISPRALTMLRFLAEEVEDGPEGDCANAFAELVQLGMLTTNETAKDGEAAYPITDLGRRFLEARRASGAPLDSDEDVRALVKAEIGKLGKQGDGVTLFGVDVEACFGFEYLVAGERVPSAKAVEHIMQIFARNRAGTGA
jgi:hypothetical protein